MTPDVMVTFFDRAGPLGLMLAYLIWREATTFKQRMAYDQARLETDKALAASLAALTESIKGSQANGKA